MNNVVFVTSLTSAEPRSFATTSRRCSRRLRLLLTAPLWFHLMPLGRMPVSTHTALSSMSCRISCMRPLSRQMASTGQLGSAWPALPLYHSMPTTREWPAAPAARQGWPLRHTGNVCCMMRDLQVLGHAHYSAVWSCWRAVPTSSRHSLHNTVSFTGKHSPAGLLAQSPHDGQLVVSPL